MNDNTPLRRMTLRQILTHTDKCARDLHEKFKTDLLALLTEFRDLSRPVRRRSSYPRMITVQNTLRKLLETHEETQALLNHLKEYLEEIRDHARREMVNRI